MFRGGAGKGERVGEEARETPQRGGKNKGNEMKDFIGEAFLQNRHFGYRGKKPGSEKKGSNLPETGNPPAIAPRGR